MSSETMIALAAALVFGAATVALAMLNYEINTSVAPLALQSNPAAVSAENRAAGCDTNGAAIFRGQLTRTCPLSLKPQSCC